MPVYLSRGRDYLDSGDRCREWNTLCAGPHEGTGRPDLGDPLLSIPACAGGDHGPGEVRGAGRASGFGEWAWGGIVWRWQVVIRSAYRKPKGRAAVGEWDGLSDLGVVVRCGP